MTTIWKITPCFRFQKQPSPLTPTEILVSGLILPFSNMPWTCVPCYHFYWQMLNMLNENCNWRLINHGCFQNDTRPSFDDISDTKKPSNNLEKLKNQDVYPSKRYNTCKNYVFRVNTNMESPCSILASSRTINLIFISSIFQSTRIALKPTWNKQTKKNSAEY